MLFKASKQGIERLEIYDSKDEASASSCSSQRIITLENCIKITRSSPTTIIIVGKSQSHEISALTEADTAKWARSLQAVAFGDNRSRPNAIDEDNDLYCSSGEGIFSVKPCSSEASLRCGLQPIEYTLLITATAIELRDIEDGKLYATWPYRYIRRYGYRGGKFTFEAGRKCETGEGTFHLKHSNPREIFRCVSLKMKSMKKMIDGESLHSLEWSDQFHQVSMMDPRSRSPLPPSARSEDFAFNSVSLKSASSISASRPLEPIKPKPAKPPRKNIFASAKDKLESECGKYKKLDDYEECANMNRSEASTATPYDKVEIRNEAWRTLGISEIDHVEFPPEVPEKSSCLRLISKSQDNLDSSTDSTKMIILQNPAIDPDDADYDRLQHFGSTSRLNRSEGYKSVLARPLHSQISINNNDSKGTWNDYDEVENVMQSVRLADDSYLGYGMLRKPSIPGPQVPNKTKPANADELSAYTDVDHCAFNGSSYAIVSKPKQV